MIRVAGRVIIANQCGRGQMMQLPILNTARLLLEPLTQAHSDGMFALWSAPEVCAHSGRAFDLHGAEIPLPAQSARDSDRIIAFFQAMQASGTGCRWAMRSLVVDAPGGAVAGAFAGAVGFNALGACAELAYHLHPRFWGNGLMQEACGAALAWVCAREGTQQVEAFIEQDNLASARLAQRLGFLPAQSVKDGAQRYVLRVPAG